MKKLLLVFSFLILAPIHAMNVDVWKGAPHALHKAAQNSEVMGAMENLASSAAHLMEVYTQKLAPALTAEQKKQCASILQHAKKMIQKSLELSKQGGTDQKLQDEIQAMGQELFFSYFPLLLSIQQEFTDQVAAEIEDEVKILAGKGFDILDNAIDSMIKVLQ